MTTAARVTCAALVAVALSAGAIHRACAQAPVAAPSRTLIRAGQLIDGIGDTPRRDQGVLVIGDRIAGVGPYDSVAALAGGAVRVDLSAASVLPGLVDGSNNTGQHAEIREHFLRAHSAAGNQLEPLLQDAIRNRCVDRATNPGYVTVSAGQYGPRAHGGSAGLEFPFESSTHRPRN
ncbi:MAG: hypothetical protein ACR2OG_15785 [Gemmatimonadaceae bacterium]